MDQRPDMMRDIVEYYAWRELEQRRKPFYRYISKDEFDSIFKNRELLFTNPMCWRDRASDPKEVYFETVEGDKEHLREAWHHICEIQLAKYKKSGLDYLPIDKTMVFGYAASAALIQQKTFVYCVSDTAMDRRMLAEYHGKWNRNIIICYKNDFYAKIAMMKGSGVINGNYLLVDVMPMVYVRDMDQYIDSVLHNGVTDQQIVQAFFDKGAFLKHSDFVYENEYRLKLRLKNGDISTRSVYMDLYNSFWNEQNEETILDACVEKINETRKSLNEMYDAIPDRIRNIGQNEYFVIDIRKPLREIVEKVYIHKGKQKTIRDDIMHECAKNGIIAEEVDFDNYLWASAIIG